MIETSLRVLRGAWQRGWMLGAGTGVVGRFCTRLAGWPTPPFYRRIRLASFNRAGYVSPSATIHHRGFSAGPDLFVDDRVLVFEDIGGGSIAFGRRVRICRDSIFQTGAGGAIRVGDDCFIQPRCQFSAYRAAIVLGRRVQVAPGCAFYPYDHGMASSAAIGDQELVRRGDIVVGDDGWTD